MLKTNKEGFDVFSVYARIECKLKYFFPKRTLNHIKDYVKQLYKFNRVPDKKHPQSNGQPQHKQTERSIGNFLTNKTPN